MPPFPWHLNIYITLNSCHLIKEASDPPPLRNLEMGRPPCCDKVGIKKGPWTPEEDIILVSYIQEHGPGNWRAVPTTTGIVLLSKPFHLGMMSYDEIVSYYYCFVRIVEV